MNDASKKDVPRVPLLSPDLKEERLAFLREVVPEAFADGKLDPARLAAALGDAADSGPERYGLSWKGKAECIRLAQRPSSATLLPDRDGSVDWDTTENLVIEGDNLEVLKLLQRGYAGKVKLIYIDPPYNTGKEFIYSDNFRDPLRQYLLDTGQIAPDSRRTTSDEDTGGRLHSRWLSMMWPRLWLARNLLAEDGVLVATIDDVELPRFRALLEDVFGEENLLGTAVWEKAYTANMTAKHMSSTHDYVLLAARDEARSQLGRIERTEDQIAQFQNPDGDPRGPWKAENLSAGKYYSAGQFVIWGPKGGDFRPPPGRYWRCNEEVYARWLSEGRIWFGKDGSGRPMLKKYLAEIRDGLTPSTWWAHDEVGTNKEATTQLKAMFTGAAVFDSPKPTRLIRRIASLCAGGSEDIVLDFFAGSGTTGDAVMRLNAEDGGKRRFILVQYPEPTEQPEFPTIADITRARLRAAKKLLEDKDTGQRSLPGAEAAPSKQDRGFRSFKLAPSNFRIWDSDGAPRDPAALAKQLAMFVDPLVEDRTPEDVVTEILLKSGAGERVVAPLSDRVEERTIAGKKVFVTSFVAGKPLLFICLERPLERELFRGMMEAGAEQIVVLDAGFAGNDGLKANIALELASHDVQLRTI